MKLKLKRRRKKMNNLVEKIVKVANMLDEISYTEDAEMLTRIAEVLADKDEDEKDPADTDDDSDE